MQAWNRRVSHASLVVPVSLLIEKPQEFLSSNARLGDDRAEEAASYLFATMYRDYCHSSVGVLQDNVTTPLTFNAKTGMDEDFNYPLRVSRSQRQ